MGKTAEQIERAGRILESAGVLVIRYGLVVILVWIGALKFAAYEAEGIEPLVSNSPLISWGYGEGAAGQARHGRWPHSSAPGLL